ncbi:MAG: serine/threonine protein kinase, partial [Rhodothermales bacterium]
MEYEREHWPLIDDLFAAALDHPPEERTAFIDRACTGNPALRDELESLLRAYHASEHYLEAIDADRARALIESVGELVCEEQRIGPYQVVRELGRGGMGAVFLAERADGQFEQQVALKLIKRGMDSDAILRRFLRERQILAHLRHENIARLLDGGVSDEDRPYFAMEYIDGLPLPDYCDTHRLDVEARLRLFQDVCRAVQYAHRSLIVHRDLKPSNMLVTEDGTVKLLDFGIAKLLDPEAQSGATALTEAGLRAMTPEYAAPEQVRGEPVTTATDVYTLGVVLYELLTGHRPYQFERREPKAIARVINDVEPELPSTAVRRETDIQHTDGTTETVTPLSVSRARSTQPDRLRRRLSGDLDTVVLKALRKEPERRYASAEAFVEDIRRHLAGLPVLAQKDTLAYRASKFVRRHTVGVVFATALGLLTLGSAVVMALQQAETMREAAKAEEVKSFVMSLFEMSDPDASKGETITA